MDWIRKTIKIQLLGVTIFAVITALFVLILMVTPIKEMWSYAAMITALSITCLFVGILEGKAVGKKGLITGLLSSVILILIILAPVNVMFRSDFRIDNGDILLLIPLIIGAIGGVIGANMDK